jgi:succinate-acetate transporter protein
MNMKNENRAVHNDGCVSVVICAIESLLSFFNKILINQSNTQFTVVFIFFYNIVTLCIVGGKLHSQLPFKKYLFALTIFFNLYCCWL